MNNTVIAIDGHSSCGKSTIAKAIAKKLGFIYVDTGAMYRAVTYYCLKNNLISADGVIDEQKLAGKLSEIKIEFRNSGEGFDNQQTILNSENIEEKIRGMEVSQHVSAVSKIKFVRDYLVKLQKQYGESQNIVMDGRDIGTVVFPDARFKFFVTASAEVRAQRRYDELKNKGEQVDFQDILKNVKDRDFQDSTRKESPLVQAKDALLLDNSNMTREEQLAWILQILKQ